MDTWRAKQEAAWLELKRQVHSYLEFQGKDTSYIDGFLEGYGRGRSAVWSEPDGFTGECADCDLVGMMPTCIIFS